MTNDDGDVMYFPEGELKSHQWISSGLMIILDLFHFLSLRKKRNVIGRVNINIFLNRRFNFKLFVKVITIYRKFRRIFQSDGATRFLLRRSADRKCREVAGPRPTGLRFSLSLSLLHSPSHLLTLLNSLLFFFCF